MLQSNIFIWIRYGLFLLALYACMIGLFSRPTEHHSSTKYDSKNKPHSSNIILVVVDALRSDMLSDSKYAMRWPTLKTAIEKGYVDCSTSMLASPTVTAPRLKAIATGRIPEFLDILYNLESKSVQQPSWVQRALANGKRLELYGDDTWLRMFPDAFGRFDGTTSFFVNDFFEVDSNVTRHLKGRIDAHSEWDLMVLHYLGIDHVGHVEGPQGPDMPQKLLEMDEVLGKLISGMESTGKDDWLIVLTGDHGMSDIGSHGGGSFSEISTTLVLISPQLKKAPNSKTACAIVNGRFETRSDQTDIATLFGLLMGVGIPEGSIGVPPTRAMQAFWRQPICRYRVLAELLHHLRDLAGCTKGYASDCSSDILMPSEIVKLNQMYDDVSAVVKFCHDPVLATFSICARIHTDVEAVTLGVTNLLTKFQQRTLLHNKNRINVNLSGCACLAMVAIAISFLLPGVRDILAYDRWLPEKSQSTVCALMFHLLGAFALSTLLIHLISLLSSSLIEEEHQTWYYISTSCLILLTIVLVISDHGESAHGKTLGVVSLVVVLCLDRFLLKLLNQTGDKWMGVPDLNDWLESHQVYLWVAQVLAWLVIFLCRAVLALPVERFRSHHHRSLVTLGLVCLSQMLYRIIGRTGNADRTHASLFAPTLVPARLAYLFVVLDLVTCLWALRQFTSWSAHLGASHTPQDSPVLTAASGRPAINPVHSFGLLVALLSRPSGVVLWMGVLLKEQLLARVFHFEFSSLSGRSMHSKQARSKMTYFIVIVYWMEAWVTFFQQGNANKFSAIDMATGYIGLSGHSHILSTLLVLSFTYAGPIFWSLSLFYRYFSRSNVNTDEFKRRLITLGMIDFALGLLTAVTAISGVVCLLMHSHLFIWTVFAPKLFFMSALCIIYVPILLFAQMV